MFDTIIIGAGPAGMAAAIYAARREMKTLIIAKEIGGQVALASEIENYPGFKSIKNFDLIDKIKEQVEGLGVEIKNDEVKKVEKRENFMLYTNKEQFESRTVILAMGLAPRRLAIPGEIELNGKGVSYCANCDGPLYKKKTVAIIGGGNAALDAAEVMSKIAAKVYLIHIADKFNAFEAIVDEVQKKPNIEILLTSETKEIIGENRVEKIKILNKSTNEFRELHVDGVFIEIGRIAHTDLVADLVNRDERNQIIVDEKCKTNAEGIFAAGDTIRSEFKQITIASGQGTIAALAAYQYLQLRAGKNGIVLDRSVKKKN